jgi:hypothetical protein
LTKIFLPLDGSAESAAMEAVASTTTYKNDRRRLILAKNTSRFILTPVSHEAIAAYAGELGHPLDAGKAHNLHANTMVRTL